METTKLTAWLTEENDTCQLDVLGLDSMGCWDGNAPKIVIPGTRAVDIIEWADARLHDHGYERIGEWTSVDFGYTANIEKADR